MFVFTESNPTPLRGLQSLLHKTYPYLVSLRKSDQHYCSGVAIAVYKVLTAAYCIHEQVQSQNFSKIRAVIELNGYEIDSGMTTGCYKNTQAYPQFDFGILTVSHSTLKSVILKKACILFFFVKYIFFFVKYIFFLRPRINQIQYLNYIPIYLFL